MTELRRYSRVYWSVMEDPRFEEVWPRPAALGLWLQLLLLADATWPIRPNLPPDSPELQLLVKADLIIPEGSYQYRVRGMEDEKQRRFERAQAASQERWNATRNATRIPSSSPTSNARGDAKTMPSKSKSERYTPLSPNPSLPTTSGKPGSHMGQHPDCIVCQPLRSKR